MDLLELAVQGGKYPRQGLVATVTEPLSLSLDHVEPILDPGGQLLDIQSIQSAAAVDTPTGYPNDLIKLDSSKKSPTTSRIVTVRMVCVTGYTLQPWRMSR